MSSGPRYRYRADPQLSASQIAEYLVASPPRRANIIREAKFPKTSIVAHYDMARDGLASFMCDGTRSIKHITDTTAKLVRRQARTDASDWIIRDCKLSNEALEAFIKAYNRLGLAKIPFHPIHGKQAPLVIGATKIQVNLDARTTLPVMNGKDRIGGAIFIFSRGETSSKRRIDRCKTIAGLIHLAVNKTLTMYGEPDASLCLAIDIFGSKSYAPPGTFARKLRHIEESCEEIADRWPKIKAPSDYDGPDYE